MCSGVTRFTVLDDTDTNAATLCAH